ncbi:MMB_0454 family protein [Mycoplasma marinum]|uniref:Uncharacterized protein n=1 Tax=Mycoplasma marinum TaxID=1937190 RepID=A0A4R0XJW0_9MOLU|nr:hypothetical protein [Mycoplasma marinum]TCG10734.1 hypothetical protein C4B24_04070 [Mycoplasma marinum]
MEYVIVNYSLNQTYNVHKQVFIQIIEKAASNLKNELRIVNDIQANIFKLGSDVEFIIEIEVSKTAEVSQVILDFSKNIEERVVDVMNSKPSNIQIKVIRRF